MTKNEANLDEFISKRLFNYADYILDLTFNEMLYFKASILRLQK